MRTGRGRRRLAAWASAWGVALALRQSGRLVRKWRKGGGESGGESEVGPMQLTCRRRRRPIEGAALAICTLRPLHRCAREAHYCCTTPEVGARNSWWTAEARLIDPRRPMRVMYATCEGPDSRQRKQNSRRAITPGPAYHTLSKKSTILHKHCVAQLLQTCS